MIKSILNFFKRKKIFSFIGDMVIVFVLSLSFYICFKYIKWGYIESFFHYPSFDEAGLLSIVRNLLEYGKYELQFNYYSVPKLFNPFISNGPPQVLLIGLAVKLFGFHYYVSNLFAFFFVNVPIIIFFLLDLSILTKKSSWLHKIIIVSGTFIYLITDRLFYSSPPTGGSFTHGALGEPFALLFILISIFFEHKAVQTKKVLLIILSGIATALAFQTKSITIFFVLPQLIILFLTFIYALLTKKKKSAFYLKLSIGFILGFIIVLSSFNIWQYTQTKGRLSKEYACWKQAVFYSKGSGIKNLYAMEINKFKSNIQNGINAMVDFYSAKLEPRWEPMEKENTVIILKISGLLILVSIIIFCIKTFLRLRKHPEKLDEITLHTMTRSTLLGTFIMGTIWFFAISDYSWTRHYYIFYFLGVLCLAVLLDDFIPQKLLEILVIFFIISIRSLLLIPQSPFYSTHAYKDIDINMLEKTDRAFIKAFSPVKNRKTYVCGYFTLWEINFLTGINFYNNILEDKQSVFPNCNALPDSKLKKITDKEFNYVITSSAYQECSEFIETNKDKLRNIYNDGYHLYTTL